MTNKTPPIIKEFKKNLHKYITPARGGALAYINSNILLWDIEKALKSQRADLIREVAEVDIEPICEVVHKAYCQYCIDVKGKEYWTKGDYSKLDEATKEADRYTVRAVIKSLLKGLKE